MSGKLDCTVDDMMEEFISDMNFSDCDLSDSIFTCVDNFIDDLCIKEMDNANSLFESDGDDSDAPFNYIIDKVLEKIDTIDSISNSIEIKDNEFCNKMDPDYCEDIDFSEISAEDFRLYNIPRTNKNYDLIDDFVDLNDNSTYDSIFNA